MSEACDGDRGGSVVEWRAAGGREKWPANRAPWIWVSLPVRVVDDFVRDLVVALTPMHTLCGRGECGW